MAGHMGVDRVTTRNHPLVKVDRENNLLLIKGALAGSERRAPVRPQGRHGPRRGRGLSVCRGSV